MRFICPEIESEVALSDQILQLYGMGEAPKEFLTDSDGNTLKRLINSSRYDSGQVKSRHFIYGRHETLARYFQSYPYAPYTPRTIAQLAASAGIAIDTNFSDSASYYFHFRAFLDPAAPFRTNLWYSVFTDNGLYLAQPLRRSGAVQLTGFTLVSVVEREEFFDNPGYTGDAAKNFLLNGDFSTIVPAAMNSAQKTRVMNKYASQNGVVKIWSGKNNVQPCDYFITGGKVYVVLSKKDLLNGMYEYIGVRETDETYSFTVTDDNYNVRPYAYMPEIVDQWHYVGTTGEPSFVYSWVNYNASAGGNMKLRFKRIPGGFLKVEGMIKSGTSNQVFTLPSGYRPANPLSSEMEGVALHYDGTTQKPGRTFVTSNGNFYVSQAQGTYWVAINLSFGLD